MLNSVPIEGKATFVDDPITAPKNELNDAAQIVTCLLAFIVPVVIAICYDSERDCLLRLFLNQHYSARIEITDKDS
jgi:hypothetical protein